MKYKAALFDLDGTLLDTLQDLADSTNAVLERHGLPTHPVEPFRHFVGNGARTLIERVLPEDRRSDELIDQCVAEMRREYTERWAATTKPYDGVDEMLDGLARLGLPMAVLSNKPDDFTKIMVEKLLPKWRFAVVQGAVPDVPLKPDPAAALGVAKTMGVLPADFVYIGDTGTDMRTARGAGMFSVGVLWGFRDAAELTENGAEVMIENPRELIDVVSG